MYKSNTIIFTVILSLPLLLLTISWQAQAAGSAPKATCYPLAHGENGQGSTNSLYLPHLRTVGYWNGYVMVSNTSDNYLNVKLNFKRYDGSPYLPYSYKLEGAFNAGNSPFGLLTGGAILKPGRTARITIYDDNNNDSLMGSVSWQADACIDHALLVSVRSYYENGSHMTSNLLLLNDGQPF